MKALEQDNHIHRQPRDNLVLLLCVSSAISNVKRRNAIRKSWFTFKTDRNGWVTPDQQRGIQLCFVVSTGSHQLLTEQEEHGDLVLVDVAEGYHNLWRKTLRSLELLDHQCDYTYYMHADDDSYVRLDLVMQLLANSPKERFYWGYVWDGMGNRVTAPIRNPNNKSHMPSCQYPLEHYPPFASGCGFVLSRDLVQALLKQPLPDYRLLDPPFGIHLCGKEYCILSEGPVQPVHNDMVRPYRGIPMFQPSTIVQHYLTPEEMMPFHQQVIASLHAALPQPSTAEHQEQDVQSEFSSETATATDGSMSAPDALYKQLVQLALLRR